MWGSYSKLAEKYGVGSTSTLVFVAYDGALLGSVSNVVKRDELEVFMKGIAQKNNVRLKKSEDSSRELDGAEKFIDEKKYADAVRKVKMVQDRGEAIDQKIIERAGEVEGKLKKICTDEIEAAKPLVDDPSKKKEAKEALESIIKAFGKYEECKEAKELLKKVD
jgi:hypothetical protein